MAYVNDTQLGYFAQNFYNKVKANFDAKGSADTALANAKTYANGLNTTMDGRVQSLETKVGDNNSGLVKDVAVLKGEANVEGSVAYQIAQIVAGADASYDTLKEIADWIMSDTTGAVKMANDITALKGLVGTIPTEATSTNVVDYIAEYVKAQLDGSNLSQYALATDLEALERKVGTATDGNTPATGLIKDIEDVTKKATDNEDAIAILNGADNVVGSVAKAVKDGVAEAKQHATDLDTTMDTRVQAVEKTSTDNKDAIAILNGADTVEGSVAKALKDAKEYAFGLDATMGNRVTVVENAIGVKSDAGNSVVATGIYARLEALENTMTNSDIDNIINGLA